LLKDEIRIFHCRKRIHQWHFSFLLLQIARLFDFTIHSSWSNNLKTKIQKSKSTDWVLSTPLPCLFWYKRDFDRQKKEKDEIMKKIKSEIRPSKFQTSITYDRKFSLRRSTRSQKTCEVPLTVFRPFLEPKKAHIRPQNCVWNFNIFFFYFFWEIV
jgi:hypothetical protein